MLGIALNDPQAVLFGWAQAATDNDLKDSAVTEMFKKQAVELGITDEEFRNALEAMRVTNELFDESGNVAQS